MADDERELELLLTDDSYSSRDESAIDHEVIVYTFGKVGSTSLTKSLDNHPRVRAFQSHFLGEHALINKLRRLLDPGLQSYFIRHGEGQLLTNIQLTRLLNSYRGGNRSSSLTVVSASRDPIDWFVSQFIQQFEGFKRDVYLLAGAPPEKPFDGQLLGRASNELLHWIKESLSRAGPLDEPDFKTKLNAEYFPSLISKEPQLADTLITHIRTFLRPHFWVQSLVSPVFGFNLSDIELNNDPFARLDLDWVTYYFFKFEELSEAFHRIVEDMGLDSIDLARENVSQAKPGSAAIKEGFSEWPTDKELRSLIECEYTRIFGYSDRHLS